MFPSICKAINARQLTDTTGTCFYVQKIHYYFLKKIKTNPPLIPVPIYLTLTVKFYKEIFKDVPIKK